MGGRKRVEKHGRGGLGGRGGREERRRVNKEKRAEEGEVKGRTKEVGPYKCATRTQGLHWTPHSLGVVYICSWFLSV